jgi:molybdopterin-guanine dinucleotide biosynthesis protein A
MTGSGGDREPVEAGSAGRLGVSVIVLAGGRSSRFGAPKLEAFLDGRPLLEHAVDLARALSDDVVVALPGGPDTGGPELAPPAPAGVRLVRDREAFGGPLVGLARALEAVDRPIAIVLAGDMPRLGVPIVEPMLIVLGSYADVDAVALERDGGPRPLPLVVRAAPAQEAAAGILAGTGERSLRALLGALRTRVIDEAHWQPLDPDGDALADVDRPSDLDALGPRGG